jgi:serine/threonine protein kinase/Tol biopolymer transport system component
MTPERWEQIGQLYEAAKELEPTQRAAFLDQACAGDEELRREVESLFAAAASVGDFIAAPALKDAAELLTDQSPGAMVGKQLGHYQVLSLIGAGGMGEVYAARDTRLGRKVAIKLLPASLSRDSDRLRRFEQEARAAGMLNHPNILTIHDIGTHEGAPYIVSELLEGETLREQIKDSPVAPRKAVDFALQITRGLAAAHERGLVHRDLKPENLFLTRDGRIKILDFGLAKLVQTRFGSIDTSGPTQIGITTSPGMVMGTVGYMAPEQVRGEEADTRADIFAFGVILYELLAGDRPFRRETAAETMSAILKADAPELPAPLSAQSPGLERVIHRCLEKRPEQRFQSASDLSFALEALTASARTSDAMPTRPLRSHIQNRIGQAGWVGWIVAGVFALATMLLTVAYLRRPAAEAETIRLTVAPPEKAVRVSDPVISPDGRRLAFVAATEGRPMLWVRLMDSLAAQPLAGTEGAVSPFWAPTGQSIGFFAGGKLKKIGLSGGAPVTLGDAPENRGGTWGQDGVILFVPHQNAGVHRVSAAGGSVTAVTTLDAARQESHLRPCFLPDGRHFLYLVTGLPESEAGLYLASLDNQERRRLLAAESNAAYAPADTAAGGGYLLFAHRGALLAQPFDAAGQRLTGEPVRLSDEVQIGPFGKGYFSVSDNGVLAYSSSSSGANQQPGWFDRTGKLLGLIGAAGPYLNAELSPDEERVAVPRLDRQTATPDIWLLDLQRGAHSRFTLDPAADFYPIWSPDSRRLAWVSLREGLFSLYQKLFDGTGQEELLLRSSHQKHPTDWSADGRFILYQENDPKTKWDVWVLPLDGERKPAPWVQTQFNETSGRFSPDSKWIAYTSDESGSNEVYVQAFQQRSSRWQISTGGGDHARWRRDGKELFYIAPDGKLMAVEVKSGASFEAGVPRALFDLRSIRTSGPNYAVADDGRKFLIVTNIEEANAAPFIVVLNWTAELNR